MTNLLTCVGVVAGAACVGVVAGTVCVCVLTGTDLLTGSTVTAEIGVCGDETGVVPFRSGVTGVNTVFCMAGADMDLGTENIRGKFSRCMRKPTI